MFVKMCGFTRLEDVRFAAQLKVHALGFNFFNGSARYIDPETAAPLVKSLPPAVEAWGLFVNAEAADIRRILKVVPLQVLQFHGDEDLAFCQSLGLPFVKAFRIADAKQLQSIEPWIPHLHDSRFLLDAFAKDQFGGTGKGLDDEILKVAKTLPGKAILAGGLTPENLSARMHIWQPFGLDVSSGIEDDAQKNPGIKSRARMQAFMDQVAQLEKS